MLKAEGRLNCGETLEIQIIRRVLKEMNLVTKVSGLVALSAVLFSGYASAATAPQTAPQQLPVLIDGVKYASNDSAVKNAKYFVYDEAAKAKGDIYGYTSKEQNQFKAELKSANTVRANTIQPNYTYSSYFYRDINYRGGYFSAYNSISWVGSYWNDNISSVVAGTNHNWTVLCWNINYGGSAFWIEGGLAVSSLVPYGWNDETSSVFFSN